MAAAARRRWRAVASLLALGDFRPSDGGRSSHDVERGRQQGFFPLATAMVAVTVAVAVAVAVAVVAVVAMVAGQRDAERR